MGDLGLVDLFEQAHLADKENLLLIVDQFEELFRFKTTQSSILRQKTSEFMKRRLRS